MSSPSSGTGWPRGRIGWIVGAIVLLVVGGLVGAILGSVWIGILLAVVVSIGWLIAYEAWRGRNPDMFDEHDDGAQL